MWWRSVFELEWTASLLPSNATPWERVIEDADSDLVARDPVSLIPAVRVAASAPVEVLPYLAAEQSVDEFSGDWTEDRQRAVITGSFAYHQVKGTRPALDRALQPLDYRPVAQEWFELDPPGPAYTFTLKVDLLNDRTWTQTDRAELVRLANNAKNAHTKLTEIGLVREAPPASVYIGGKVFTRRVLRIREKSNITNLPVSGLVFIAASLRTRRSLRIKSRPV